MKNYIIKFIDLILGRFVMISPECPKCSSPATGQIIEINNINRRDYDVRRSHLRNGEYIKPIYLHDSMRSTNCFCANCGFEWYSEEQHLIRMPRSKIKSFKKYKLIEPDKDNFESVLDRKKAYMAGYCYEDYKKIRELHEKEKLIRQQKPISEETEQDENKEEIVSKPSYIRKEKENIAMKATKILIRDYVYSPTIGVLKDLIPKEKHRKY